MSLDCFDVKLLIFLKFLQAKLGWIKPDMTSYVVLRNYLESRILD